jgi:hypothetical protein
MATRRGLVLVVERRMEKTGELCGSVRGARGGSTVGGLVRRGIGLGIGVIVWRVELAVGWAGGCCLGGDGGGGVAVWCLGLGGRARHGEPCTKEAASSKY